MADALSTLYGFTKPEVGASADTWGTKLNADISAIDKLLGAIVTTGSSNAYVLTTGQSLVAYVTLQSFFIQANFTNSGPATINVDGLGAKSLVKNASTALASGDMTSGRFYRVTYDGTNFIVGGVFSDAYQPADATLAALAALSWASLKPVIQFTAADTVSLTSTPQFTTVDIGDGTSFTFDVSASRARVEGDNIVLATTTDTLTNKTLTSPTINGGTESTRIQLSSETSGTLTSASANKKILATGGITLPNSVFSAQDMIIIEGNGTARTITRGASITMYIGGVDSATGTLAANGVMLVTWRTASIAILNGDIS